MISPQISFVIPLYNESEVFPVLIDRLNQFLMSMKVSCEIILVDDGSKDDTAFLITELALQNKHYQGLLLSRNFGHQYALTAGLKFARGTEAVMILDGDLQDPPELFHEFYAALQEGNDVVFAVRKKRKEGILKKMSYRIFYRLLKGISNSPISTPVIFLCGAVEW